MKVNAQTRWLRGEVEKWTAENIISRSQADSLLQKYPEEEGGLPWGIIVFSSLGSILVGLGVILLFAYNWDVIPRMGKLAIIFASLCASHISGFLLTRSRRYITRLRGFRSNWIRHN